MTRTNNDNNIFKKNNVCKHYLFQNVSVPLKKYPLDFNMFKYFHIHIGPADIQCQDLGPRVSGSTYISLSDPVPDYIVLFTTRSRLQ